MSWVVVLVMMLVGMLLWSLWEALPGVAFRRVALLVALLLMVAWLLSLMFQNHKP